MEVKIIFLDLIDSRQLPDYKRDVCDVQMTSRPWWFNTQSKCKVFASWRKKSWAMDEAMKYNGWTLTLTMVWLNGNGNWQRCLKRIRRRVVRSKKQTEWEKVDHCHARGGVLLSIVWLEDKKKWLNYKRDVCDALVSSRPWMIVYKKVLLNSSIG